MEGKLLSPEEIKKFRTLRGIYSEGHKPDKSFEEQRHIWNEQILPHITPDEESYILMDDNTFNLIVEVSEKPIRRK